MLFMISMCYVYVFCLGSFPVNNIPVQVLFDSGTTRSFVSLALGNRFSESSGMVDHPLEVQLLMTDLSGH